MRAVNLIPPEARRGERAGSAPSGGVLGLLGGLALLVLAVALVVLSSNQAADKRSELGALKARSAAATARATALQSYTNFASLEQSRVSTVKQLAASRFNWYRSLSDLSHVVGPHIWLSGLTGTVTPDVQLDGGTSGTGFRSALPNPAVELSGCATSNRQVVGFVSRLRAMEGVQRVTLSAATKADSTTSGASAPSSGGSAGGSGNCGSDQWPAFALVIFYAPLPGGPPPSSSAATPTAAATAPAAGGTTSSPSTTGATTPAPAGTTTAPATGAAQPASSTGGTGR